MKTVFDYLYSSCENAQLSKIQLDDINSIFSTDKSIPEGIMLLRVLRAIEKLDKDNLTDDEKEKISKIKRSYNNLVRLAGPSKFIFNKNNITETKVNNEFYRDLLNYYIKDEPLSDKVINLIAFYNDDSTPVYIKNEIEKIDTKFIKIIVSQGAVANFFAAIHDNYFYKTEDKRINQYDIFRHNDINYIFEKPNDNDKDLFSLLCNRQTDMVEKCVKVGKVMLVKVAMLYEVMGIEGDENKVNFINELKKTFQGTVLESAFEIDFSQGQNHDIILKNKACEILAEYDTNIKYICKCYLDFRPNEYNNKEHKQTIIDNFHAIRDRVPSEIIIETKKQKGYWFNDPMSPMPIVIAAYAVASLFPAGLITSVVLGYATGTLIIPTLVSAGALLLGGGYSLIRNILSLELKDTGHKVESKDFLGKITSNNELVIKNQGGNKHTISSNLTMGLNK